MTWVRIGSSERMGRSRAFKQIYVHVLLDCHKVLENRTYVSSKSLVAKETSGLSYPRLLRSAQACSLGSGELYLLLCPLLYGICGFYCVRWRCSLKRMDTELG